MLPTELSWKLPATMVPGKLGFCQLNEVTVLPAAAGLGAPSLPLPTTTIPAGAVTLMVAVKRSAARAGRHKDAIRPINRKARRRGRRAICMYFSKAAEKYSG